MTDLTNFYLSDGEVLFAEWVNRFIASGLLSYTANEETIVDTKVLADSSSPIQRLEPSGADRDVILPEVAATNHPFWISNPSEALYNLVVKSGEVTLVTLAAGDSVLVISDGSVWGVVGGGGNESGGGSGGGGVTVETDATLTGDGTSSNPLGVIENVVTATVTSADVMAVESSLYVLDLSGLTVNRDFVLPTPSMIGKRIKVKINVGNDTYALRIVRNATEVTRLFISGETLEFVSIGTGSGDWVVTQDGRIPCVALFRRVGSDANTTHAANTWIKADWNSIDVNIGNCADLTNIRFTARRGGHLCFTGSYAPATGITGQRHAGIRIYKNGTGGSAIVSSVTRFSFTTSSTNLFFTVNLSSRITPTPAQPGDFYEYYFNTQESNRGLRRSDNGDAAMNESTYFQIKEILSAI